MGIPKIWGKDKDGNRGFLFSHVKTIYYNWASKILLSTKLDEMDALIDAKIAKAMMSNQQVNATDKVPTSALAYAMSQNIANNANAIAQLNSNSLVYKGNITSGNDFNNYVTPGIYSFNGKPDNTIGENLYGILTVKAGNTYITQSAYSMYDKHTYERSMVIGNQWSAWQEVVTKSDLNYILHLEINGKNTLSFQSVFTPSESSHSRQSIFIFGIDNNGYPICGLIILYRVNRACEWIKITGTDISLTMDSNGRVNVTLPTTAYDTFTLISSHKIST